MSEILKIAENINTPPAQLRELANNPRDLALLVAITKNPNTPSDLLIELAGYKECFDAIGNNPALENILLEHPNFLKDIYFDYIFEYYDGIGNLYDKTYFPLPNWFLKFGLKDPNFEVRGIVIERGNMPISVLEKFSGK